jgi:hypothetical protein
MRGAIPTPNGASLSYKRHRDNFTFTLWVPKAFTPEVTPPAREADHLSPSSAEGKNAWSFTSTPPVFLHAVVLR